MSGGSSLQEIAARGILRGKYYQLENIWLDPIFEHPTLNAEYVQSTVPRIG